MGVMAKKRNDSKRTQGVDRHVKPRLAFHLEKQLLDAVEQLVETTRPQPTVTSVITAALEEYLTARGLWPPPPKDKD